MTASQLQAKRVRFYRRYKKIVQSLNTLLENGVINGQLHSKIMEKWDLQYEIWKEELLEERRPHWRTRGRKPISQPSGDGAKCRNHQCSQAAAPGMGYCSPKCSPCGYLMDPAFNRKKIAGARR